MKLRFNEGAIVKFGLVTNTSIAGKVVSVTEDEVVLITQKKLYNYDSYRIFFDKSADDKTIHLNRLLISSWEYATVFDFDQSVSFVNSKSDLNRPLFKKEENLTINIYENGICKGTGKWCGDIDDNFMLPVVFIKEEDSLDYSFDGDGYYGEQISMDLDF